VKDGHFLSDETLLSPICGISESVDQRLESKFCCTVSRCGLWGNDI